MPLRRPVLWILVAALVLAVAAPAATAKERSDTESIAAGEYASIKIGFRDGPAMEVGYEVQVTDGPNIDIFVFDNANYQNYQDGREYEYRSGPSDLDTADSRNEFTLEDHGTWWIVLDNTGEGSAAPPTVGEGTAQVDWTARTNVDVEEGLRSLPSPGLIWVAVVGVGAAVAVRRR